MNDEYYESLLTGTLQGKKSDIDLVLLEKLIHLGLSSVKISKVLKVSYMTVLNRTDNLLPNLSDKLRANGRKHMIRRKING